MCKNSKDHIHLDKEYYRKDQNLHASCKLVTHGAVTNMLCFVDCVISHIYLFNSVLKKH